MRRWNNEDVVATPFASTSSVEQGVQRQMAGLLEILRNPYLETSYTTSIENKTGGGKMSYQTKKLTKANVNNFFDDRAIGAMITASKSFQYAEIQEIATLQGVAVRRPTWDEINRELDLHFADHEHSAKDIIRDMMHKGRLFMVITHEEYVERAMSHQRRLEVQRIGWATDSVDDWFDNIIKSLEWVVRDIKEERARAKGYAESDEHVGYKLEMSLNSALNRLKGILFNLPLDQAVRLTANLREALDDEAFKSPY
jgi:hypothetical protein